MFGYIMPEKQELKMREYALFRAYYCGLCRTLGKRYGVGKRLLLSYDTTFLGLLLSSLMEGQEQIIRTRCMVHPVMKKPMVDQNPFLDYSADLTILLAYHNLMDDWKDEKNPLPLVAAGWLHQAYGKAKKRLPLQEKFIRERLREIAWMEEERCSSMDRVADVFGRLIRDLMSFYPLSRSERDGKALGWLGYNVGKWIYILDAYDDLEKDIRKKNYNVLLLQYEYQGEELSSFKEKVIEPVRFNLIQSLGQASKSFELMEIGKNRSLMENILYLGMHHKTEEILSGRSCRAYAQSLSGVGDTGGSFGGGDPESLPGTGQEVSS